MGLDDIAKGALLLIGVGLISKRFGAGVGLGELGTGVSTLVAAPAVGVGTGLSAMAGGVRDIAETFGDLGRGIAAIFEGIPKFGPSNGAPPALPDQPGTGLASLKLLTTDGGGSSKTLLAGGGGNVPQPLIAPLVIQPDIFMNGVQPEPRIYTPTPLLPGIALDPGIRAERRRLINTGSYGGSDHLVML